MSRSPQRERKLRQKSHKSTAVQTKKQTPVNAPLGPFPPPFMMERIMAEMGLPGGKRSRKDSVWEAQELAYKAMEAATLEDAIRLAGQALHLDKGCLDAMMLIATIASGGDAQRAVENFSAIVAVGRRRLGEKFFQENEGHFWGILETRPYMRAHARLAQILVECGRMEEAIEHFEQLLTLNPNDNQGLRYELLCCFLQCRDLDGAAELFRRYDKEDFAIFQWGRVLHKVLSHDPAGAAKLLIDARKQNKHVEAYLSGSKKMPDELPGYHGFGDVNEAVCCVDMLGPAWKAHLEAMVWLKAQSIPRVRKSKAAPVLRLLKED